MTGLRATIADLQAQLADGWAPIAAATGREHATRTTEQARLLRRLGRLWLDLADLGDSEAARYAALCLERAKALEPAPLSVVSGGGERSAPRGGLRAVAAALV